MSRRAIPSDIKLVLGNIVFWDNVGIKVVETLISMLMVLHQLLIVGGQQTKQAFIADGTNHLFLSLYR